VGLVKGGTPLNELGERMNISYRKTAFLPFMGNVLVDCPFQPYWVRARNDPDVGQLVELEPTEVDEGGRAP